MVLVKNIGTCHLINIPRHVISHKIHAKAWSFQCEMEYQCLKMTKMR